jgi:hypothetical protein
MDDSVANEVSREIDGGAAKGKEDKEEETSGRE